MPEQEGGELPTDPFPSVYDPRTRVIKPAGRTAWETINERNAKRRNASLGITAQDGPPASDNEVEKGRKPWWRFYNK